MILAFIGAKLMLEFAHHQDHSIPEISTGISLAVIAAVLTANALASIIKTRRQPGLHAHAGALRERHHDADTPGRDRPRVAH